MSIDTVLEVRPLEPGDLAQVVALDESLESLLTAPIDPPFEKASSADLVFCTRCRF